MSPPLFLASTSPRRRELLQQIGLAFSVLKVDVDESVKRRRAAGRLCAASGARERRGQGLAQITAGVVVAADTSVVLDDEVLGKPASAEEAMAMWQRLVGAHASGADGCGSGRRQPCRVQVVSHARTFSHIGHLAEMHGVLAKWRAGDKAGGYAIQGRGAVFVDAIEGSYSNVVGLPLTETAALLAQFGIRILG
jgi:septum formation protein